MGNWVKRFLKFYSLAFKSLTIFCASSPVEGSLRSRAESIVFCPVGGSCYIFGDVNHLYFDKMFYKKGPDLAANTLATSMN